MLTTKREVKEIFRGCILQDSSFDPLHKHNGKVCIVVEYEDTNDVRLYFTEGAIYSMEAKRSWVTRSYHNRGFYD